MKIVINGCFGGFSLSEQGMDLYKKLGGTADCNYDIDRDDPHLVSVVETLGEHANGSCAELYIVDIPDDVKWHISEYDGMEHVAEDHRTWS